MDFRDLFRGFFGITRRSDPERGRTHFDGEDTENKNSSDKRTDYWEEFVKSRDFTADGYGQDRDTINSMEDMFKELEQSMREIDSFFNGDIFSGNEQSPFGLRLFGRQLPHPSQGFSDELPSLPPPDKNTDNVRNLVLKEPDTRPVDKQKKMDKDLDDLLHNANLPLSEIPNPPKETMTERNKQLTGITSFERKWEGKTVREDQEGKEITTYTRNADGELIENTEFIPKTDHSRNNEIIKPFVMDQGPNRNMPFQSFLDRFFKPKF